MNLQNVSTSTLPKTLIYIFECFAGSSFLHMLCLIRPHKIEQHIVCVRVCYLDFFSFRMNDFVVAVVVVVIDDDLFLFAGCSSSSSYSVCV